jgi:hypothetical protein
MPQVIWLKPGTIKTYRFLVRRLASLMDAAGVTPRNLTMELAAQLVSAEERNRREPNKCQNIAGADQSYSAHANGVLRLRSRVAWLPSQLHQDRRWTSARFAHLRQRGLLAISCTKVVGGCFIAATLTSLGVLQRAHLSQGWPPRRMRRPCPCYRRGE